MCRHLCSIAATVHRTPAPGARSRGVDERNGAVDAFAALDSGREWTRGNLDHVSGDRREECGDPGRGHPRSIAVRIESRHEARQCGERVERRTVRGPDCPAVDDRLGGIPDAARSASPPGRSRPCPDPGRTEDVAAHRSRSIGSRSVSNRSLSNGCTGDRERKRQAARIESEYLAIGMMELEDAAVQHVTSISGYVGPDQPPVERSRQPICSIPPDRTSANRMGRVR